MFGEEYTSIYPKVKIWTTSLMLTRGKIDELLRMNLAEYVRHIKTSAKKIEFNTEDPVLLEGLIKQEGYYFLESISRFLLGAAKDFIRNWSKIYEIENLKIITRAILNKKPINFLYRIQKKSRIQLEFVKDVKTLEELQEFLSGTDYYRLALDALPRISEEKNTFYFEINLDNFYALNLKKKMIHLGVNEKREIKDLFFHYLNVNRILWIYRAKYNYSLSNEEIIATVPNILGVMSKMRYQKLLDSETNEMFIDNLKTYGLLETRNPVNFNLEKEIYYKLLKKGKEYLIGLPFSLGVFLGFYILHTIHVKNMITIMEGKKMNIDNEKILEMLIFD